MPRERDLSFEKLIEVCGIEYSNLTPTTRGAVNAALKDIKLGTPDLDDADLAMVIEGRAEMYVKVMDGALLTPTALSKHWASLEGMLAAQKKAAPTTNAYAPPSNCETCDGMRFVLAFYRNPGVRTPDAYDAERHGHEVWAACPDCNVVGQQVIREYLSRFNKNFSGGPRLAVPEASAQLFGQVD